MKTRYMTAQVKEEIVLLLLVCSAVKVEEHTVSPLNAN